MKKLYSICDLVEKYGSSANGIRLKIRNNKIKADDIGTGIGSPRFYYLSSVSNILDMNTKCNNCNKKFKGNRSTDKYCSKYCRVAKKNKMNKKTDRVKSFSEIGTGDFPTGDRSYQTKKGKEDMKNIMKCSVDCLIKELGDLE